MEKEKVVLEEMASFFGSRVKEYDEHQIRNLEGDSCYQEFPKFLPDTVEKILDLGCGTGLELEQIFKRFPELQVTGIDLSEIMLHKLKEKIPDKKIELCCQSYFDYEFPMDTYDAAISVMTLHHFSHEKKIDLYRKIYQTLKENGRYVECDYMIPDDSVANPQQTEDFFFSEYQRLLKEMGNPEGFFHYDTPCTVSNQIKMLKEAGFQSVKKVWENGSTVILVAEKKMIVTL